MSKPIKWGGTRTRLQPQDDLSAALGARFRQVREAQGVTLQRLAEAMDRQLNIIRFHEAGVRLLRADDLTRAAIAIGVAPRTLLLPADEVGSIEGEGDGRTG